MASTVLEFNPVDCIYFVPNGPTFKADIQITNTSGAFAVFKVKTNKADRYTVKPHIGLLAPQESRIVTFSVQQSHLDAFLEDMVRQGNDGKLQTAFLVLIWSLPDEIVPQLAQSPKETLSATLQHFVRDGGARVPRLRAPPHALSPFHIRVRCSGKSKRPGTRPPAQTALGKRSFRRAFTMVCG